ncbi:MAG: hypothetical protein KFF77_03960 [Bacteroidetes bacterium]|nr:hypothetical protein [Bacteroidota bacterium]
MLRFYRLDHDEENNAILTEVPSCAIQGDRIPAVSNKYANILFHLAIVNGTHVAVRREFCDWISDEVIAKVEDYINSAKDIRSLPTYIYDQTLLNNADLVPRLHIVYIAESEESVRAFMNS